MWRVSHDVLLRLAMAGSLVALALGVTDQGLAQPKARIAVTAFENKVKMPLPDPSWKIGEGFEGPAVPGGRSLLKRYQS